MHAITLVLVTLALVALYAFVLLPVLKERPELASVYAVADAWEAGIWARFKLRLKGFKTLAFARFLQIAGILLGAHDTLATVFGGLDLTPVTSRALAFIPDDLRPLVLMSILAAIGWIVEKLRRVTTGPVPEAQ